MQKNVKTTCQNILWLCKHEQKTRHPKIKIFLSLNYTTFLNYWGLEQLSSSICWRVMAKYNIGWIYHELAFVRVKIFTNFWLWDHSFDSRYAWKPIKGSKVSDDSLVSKTSLSQNIGRFGWRPVPGKVGKKTQKHRHLWRPPQRTQNNKNLFQRKLEDCWIRTWFKQLSNSIDWRVMKLQKFANSGQKSGLCGPKREPSVRHANTN